VKRIFITLAVTAFALLPLAGLGWLAVIALLFQNRLEGVAGLAALGGYVLFAAALLVYLVLRMLMGQVRFLLWAGIVLVLLVPAFGFILFGL
jgi:hypothetical protein